jgi:hypothetical protein
LVSQVPEYLDAEYESPKGSYSFMVFKIVLPQKMISLSYLVFLIHSNRRISFAWKTLLGIYYGSSDETKWFF